MTHLLPRTGGFRNGPEQGGTGVNVRRGDFVFSDPVRFDSNLTFNGTTTFNDTEAVDFPTAPTVGGRATTREITAVSPVGGAPVAALSFGSVTLAAQLVADERIIGYDFPSTGLTVGITFEGFRILTGTDIEFVWQNVTALGVTIPTLTWNIVIGRV